MTSRINPRGREAVAIFVEDEEPIASRIVYVNEAFERMSGYTAAQLVGHSALLLAGASPSGYALRAAREAKKSGRPYTAIERKKRPDGSTYFAEIRLEALGRTQGHQRHIVLMQREVTDVDGVSSV